MPSVQQTLFDSDPAPWELDDAERKQVASVVLTNGPDRQYDYLAPDRFLDDRRPEVLIEPGRRVRVPFGRGNRTVTGYCIEVSLKSVGGRKLKEVAEVIDAESLLSPGMLRLTRWMADYYLCPLGQVLEAVVPAGVRGKAGTRDVLLLSVPTNVAARLTSLDLTDTQRRVLETLAASPKPLAVKQLMTRAECSVGPINTLRKKGYIASHTERLDLGELEQVQVDREMPKELNDDQRTSLREIRRAMDAGEPRTLLLHGVTGSGKTEVYIQAIEKVVGFGRQAIVLVPEISLTPQTVRRFRARFDRIAVLHSHLSDVERHRQWRRIAAGQVEVVVGARSAIFAPTPHLGLIVLDEEHENSFKQDSAPRYHAREVALQRSRSEQIPLVLASATPSLESWRLATEGDHQLITMPKRVNNLLMPDVRVIDLREETHRQGGRGGRGALSRPLRQAMEAALYDDGQIILLLNRRGFSTHVQCPECGFVLNCPACEVALTFHRHDQTTLCHWCDHRATPPKVCPDCRSQAIRYGGLGTQKLEAEVRARFPKATTLRMDADSMRRPGSHEKALDSFRHGETQILLGTQMIAKGLDFPNVTVVGVINADTALHWPDFRAGERTFHLVTQVAGRTGRSDRGGRVLVQTLDPEHPAIVAASRHDYDAFARQELPVRESLGYPPYGSMARLVFRGPAEKPVEALAEQVAQVIGEAWPSGVEHRLVGPAPAPMAKLRGSYRYHLQIQSPQSEALRQAIRQAMEDIKSPEGLTWTVDIDPIDMM